MGGGSSRSSTAPRSRISNHPPHASHLKQGRLAHPRRDSTASSPTFSRNTWRAQESYPAVVGGLFHVSLDDGASAQRGLRGVHELGRRIGGASVLGGALKLGGRLHQPSRPAPA